MSEYYIGEIFKDEYPQDCAEWCNESGIYYIEEIEKEYGHRRFEIKEITPETPAERHQRLKTYSMTKQDFFNYILKSYDFTYTQLMQIVNSSEDYQVAWNLCNNVYRGNTILIKALQTYIPSLTDEELDDLFEEYGH